MIRASVISKPLSVYCQGSLTFPIPSQSIFKSLKMAPRRVSLRRAAPETEGLKVAQEVAHEVEENLG
jgi:hypothetical protein